MSLTYIPEEFNILVSSDPLNGARNRTADGSSFSVQLNTPIQIPAEAKHIHVSVPNSTIWNVVPNIIEGVNDTMYITENANNYVIVIPQGLYDLPSLNNAIAIQLENEGALTNPSILTLVADESTQKVIIKANYTGVSIDFTPDDTFRDILGFDARVVGPSTLAPENFIADNVAGFNVLEYFKIHSDIVPMGIQQNEDFDQTIAQVQISALPGSQIIDAPFLPAKSEASYLAGTKKKSIRFWLTDQRNNLVNTNGEYYSARITIAYLLPEHIA